MTNRYEFTCADGSLVNIEVDPENCWAKVTTPQGDEIGQLEFVDYPDGRLRLDWATLRKVDYRRKGIGRFCLGIMADRLHQPVAVDLGARVLTAEAHAFVVKMREEGLVGYVENPPPRNECEM